MSRRAPLEVVKRSELTKVMCDHLATTLGAAVLLGRGTAPQGGGWPDGSVAKGPFQPYVVVKAGQAVSPAPGERDSLAANRSSWLVSYALTTHHSAESKVDESADAVRDAVVTFARAAGKVELDGVVWVVQQVMVSRLGATTPTRATNPAHWQVTDDVSLHLSRDPRA